MFDRSDTRCPLQTQVTLADRTMSEQKLNSEFSVGKVKRANLRKVVRKSTRQMLLKETVTVSFPKINERQVKVKVKAE